MADPNLAVVIAVSKYDGLGSSLPACVKDGDLMEAVLLATGRFLAGNILVIVGKNTNSTSVKAKLSEFVEARKGTDHGEVLFYFSGHGMFDSQDFRFLFSDFDLDKRNQTSLSNSELDGMLRSLNPKLAVKVVDACQSGVQYVKETDAIEKALDVTKGQFKECYFMFSSRHDQSSYQDKQLSHFTREFAVALKKPDGQAIRYKDIADSIADAFAKYQTDQRPFFVTQGAFTHLFCSVTPELVAVLDKHLPSGVVHNVKVTDHLGITDDTMVGAGQITSPPPEPNFDELILAKVHEEAPKYGSKQDGDKTALAAKEVIEAAKAEGILENLYTLEVKVDTHSGELPNEGQIGGFFEDKADYFVTVDYTGGNDSRYGIAAMVAATDIFNPNRRRVSGYTNTVKMPLEVAVITAKPKHENLPWWRCHFAFAYSKTEFRYFYAIYRMKDTGWDSQLPPGKIKWYTDGVALKDHEMAVTKIKTVLKLFPKTIIKKLAERYNVPMTDTVPDV